MCFINYLDQPNVIRIIRIALEENELILILEPVDNDNEIDPEYYEIIRS